MRRALPRRRTRLMLLAALAACLLVALVAAQGAFADAFTPESGGSPNADDIDTLYKITLYVAIVIFLVVEGTLIWSLVTYRARRGGPEAGPDPRQHPARARLDGRRGADPRGAHGGHLPVPGRHQEPAAVRPQRARRRQAQFASIDQPEAAGRRRTGAATSWSTASSTSGATTTRATSRSSASTRWSCPRTRPSPSTITAADVIHSWWIPKLGGKADGVPGHMNKTWFKIPAKRGHLPSGPVRRALRRQPRRHARRGPRGHAGAVHEPGPSASAPTSRPPARRWRSAARAP